MGRFGQTGKLLLKPSKGYPPHRIKLQHFPKNFFHPTSIFFTHNLHPFPNLLAIDLFLCEMISFPRRIQRCNINDSHPQRKHPTGRMRRKFLLISCPSIELLRRKIDISITLIVRPILNYRLIVSFRYKYTSFPHLDNLAMILQPNKDIFQPNFTCRKTRPLQTRISRNR